MYVPRSNVSHVRASVAVRSSPALIVGVVVVVFPVAVPVVVLPVCRGTHPSVPARAPAPAPRAGMMGRSTRHVERGASALDKLGPYRAHCGEQGVVVACSLRVRACGATWDKKVTDCNYIPWQALS